MTEIAGFYEDDAPAPVPVAGYCRCETPSDDLEDGFCWTCAKPIEGAEDE